MPAVTGVRRLPGATPTLRFPTFEEMRVMTFMRLVKDVKGLFFFAFSDDRVMPWMEIFPAHWENMGRTVKSVHSVFPALFSSEIATGYTVSDKRVYSIMKRVKEGGKGYYYLMAVNPACEDKVPPEDYPVALGEVTFGNIKAPAGAVVTVLDEVGAGRFKPGGRRKVALEQQGGACRFTDNFGELSVHVYRIGPL